ncbi:cytochrome P450, partial [Chaetomium strumarium]
PTLTTSLAATAALLIFYFLASVIYSLTFHHLANFPGPVSCAVSRIPFWVACVKGTQVQWMHSLHARYGPVVRYSPNDLSYVDEGTTAWKAIHNQDRTGRREFPKAREWFVTPANGVYGINSAAEHEDHRRYRRVFAPAFSERAMKSQEPLFREHVDLLVSKLDEMVGAGQPVDMCMLYQLTTFDIMSDLTFGQSFAQLEDKTYLKWVQAVFDSVKAIPIAQVIQYYPLLNTLFQLFEPKFVKDMKYNHFKHSAERVDKRLAQGSDKPDIWNMVLKVKGKLQLSREEMYCHADVFMLAGSETTGTAMSGLTYYLLTNRDKLALLTQEIRAHHRTEEDITMDSVASLPYLNACINEALRLYPPVPVGVPRVVPAEGRVLLDKFVGGGTRVSVHHYSTYRSPANFADPDAFAPERWLPTTTTDSRSRYADDRREALQAFGYGPRNCLGQNMALHEMRLVLARLFFRFDLELLDESRDWTDQKAFVLWEKKPLLCRLKAAV